MSAYQLEQSALARAVRADYCDNFTLADLQISLGNGFELVEGFLNVSYA
jgi:hypothetical protein